MGHAAGARRSSFSRSTAASEQVLLGEVAGPQVAQDQDGAGDRGHRARRLQRGEGPS